MADLLRYRSLLLGTRDRAGISVAAASLIVLLGHWITVLWFVVPRLGTLDFLRLHSTAGLGIDWIDAWWYLFTYPVAGFAVLLVNVLLASILARRHHVLGLLVLSATLVVQVFLATGGVIAVILNR
jgi:hypothetical protein